MTDEEFRAKWIAALRSGDYKQGKTFLRDGDDHYCCIGVAASVHPGFKWIAEDLGAAGTVYNAQHGDECGYGQLLESGLETIGISRDAQDALIGLNDDQGFTFSEIADVLEAKLYDKTGVVI